MNDLLNLFMTSVLPALLGGGLVAVWTLPEKKSGARLDNAERVIKKYEEIIARLDSDNTKKDERIKDLEKKVSGLEAQLCEVTTKLKTLQLIEEEDRALRCEKLKCTKRKPAIDMEKLNDIVEGDVENDN